MKESTKPTYLLGQPMDKAFNGMNPKEIIDNMEAVCYKKEEGTYTKNLTEEELGVTKSEFADVGIKIALIEGEKKERLDEFKAKLTDPKAKQSNLLGILKHKNVTKEGTLYLMDDPETNMMYKFDENGICVDVRPMLQAEKQQVLRQLKIANGED